MGDRPSLGAQAWAPFLQAMNARSPQSILASLQGFANLPTDVGGNALSRVLPDIPETHEQRVFPQSAWPTIQAPTGRMLPPDQKAQAMADALNLASIAGISINGPKRMLNMAQKAVDKGIDYGSALPVVPSR